MTTQIGDYRTADGGLAAYDKNGLTWRIQDQAPEEETPADAGIPVPLVATTEPLVHEVTTPLPETEWTGGEYDVDPFAGIEEGE